MGFCLLIAVIFWCCMLASDRHKLGKDLIRLHVVANSDSESDQQRKLLVRDAVLESLEQDLYNIADPQTAREYIRDKIPYIQNVVQETLRSLGCQDAVQVTLSREAFDKRVYDTFSLPAGVYHSLRIIIGNGDGKNWWCVVYPGLCIPVASDAVETVAATAGFSDTLTGSITGAPGYELRFWILDVLGSVENMVFEGRN